MVRLACVQLALSDGMVTRYSQKLYILQSAFYLWYDPEVARAFEPEDGNLRYQYNPFDHPCAVHSNLRGFNKNPYKPYIYWKLNSYR